MTNEDTVEDTTGSAKPSADELLSAARELWDLPEREFQYAGCGLLSRHAKLLGTSHLVPVRDFIVTKSWWGTVDTLAANVVGTMVTAEPDLRLQMDQWIADDNLWVVRTALLHQLRFKASTDAGRLFRYCAFQAGHRDFFIRKADRLGTPRVLEDRFRRGPVVRRGTGNGAVATLETRSPALAQRREEWRFEA